MSTVSDIATFVAVAEARSFSEAARRLQVTTASVSKSVIRLETRLGVRLFTRTTRRVVPTSEGAEFYTRVRDILERLAEAEAEIGLGARGLTGEVRIAAPTLIGQQVLAPILAAFRRSHSEIILDVRLSDHFANLVSEGIDLALRLGELDDSSMVARRVAMTRFVTCASPAYLDRNGTPHRVQDLNAHSCVTYVVQGSGRPFDWVFRDGVSFAPERAVLVGDGGANRAFALAGLGIIQEIDIAVREDLRSGALVQLLGEMDAAGPPLSLVQPAGRFIPRRVRAVAEYVSAALARQPQ